MTETTCIFWTKQLNCQSNYWTKQNVLCFDSCTSHMVAQSTGECSVKQDFMPYMKQFPAPQKDKKYIKRTEMLTQSGWFIFMCNSYTSYLRNILMKFKFKVLWDAYVSYTERQSMMIKSEQFALKCSMYWVTTYTREVLFIAEILSSYQWCERGQINGTCCKKSTCKDVPSHWVLTLLAGGCVSMHTHLCRVKNRISFHAKFFRPRRPKIWKELATEPTCLLQLWKQ